MTTTTQNSENAVQSAPLQLELRDWFAGQALTALGTWMPVPKSGHPSLHSDETLKSRAEIAYRQADAMLLARKAGGE